MITKRVVTAAVTTTTTNSSSVTVNMPKTIRGIVMYKTASGADYSTVTFKMQGRLGSDLGWVDVADSTSAHTSDTTTSKEDISLYPEMRGVMTLATVSTAVCDIQIGC